MELLLKLLQNSCRHVLFLFSSEDRERKRHLTQLGGGACPFCKYAAWKISQSSFFPPEFTSVAGLQPLGRVIFTLICFTGSWTISPETFTVLTLVLIYRNSCSILGAGTLQEPSSRLACSTVVSSLQGRTPQRCNKFRFNCDITYKPQAPQEFFGADLSNYSAAGTCLGPIKVPVNGSWGSFLQWRHALRAP